MESNSVCNHTNNYQNRTIAKRESDMFNHEYDYRPKWTARSFVPIDHNYNEIFDNLGFFKSKHKKFREFFLVAE